MDQLRFVSISSERIRCKIKPSGALSLRRKDEVLDRMRLSRLFHWLKNANPHVYDEHTLQSICCSNAYLQFLLGLRCFREARPANTTTLQDKQQFLDLCQRINDAYASRATAAHINPLLTTMAKLLGRCFLFDETQFQDDDHFWAAFNLRDEATSTAARVHTVVNCAFVAGVLGQFVSQAMRNPAYMVVGRWIAGTSQCLTALNQLACDHMPGGPYAAGFIGVLQLLSDLSAWLDPQMHPNTDAVQLRQMRAFARELEDANKINGTLWSSHEAPLDDATYLEWVRMWGHYFLFTFMFTAHALPSAFASNLVWRLGFLVVLSGVMVLSGYYQYNEAIARMAPGTMDPGLHALHNATLRVAVTARTPQLAVLQQSANYLLGLALAHTHMASLATPRTAEEFFDGFVPKATSTHEPAAEWRSLRRRRHQSEAIQWLGRAFRSTRISSDDMAQTTLDCMKTHLDVRNSLVFRVLFPKLHAAAAGSEHNRYLLLTLFKAFKHSVMAYTRFARAEGYRSPDEALYADVYFNEHTAQVSKADFLKLLETMDNKLTQVLVTRAWKDYTPGLPHPAYPRTHLTLYRLVDDPSAAHAFPQLAAVNESHASVFHHLTLADEARLVQRITSGDGQNRSHTFRESHAKWPFPAIEVPFADATSRVSRPIVDEDAIFTNLPNDFTFREETAAMATYHAQCIQPLELWESWQTAAVQASALIAASGTVVGLTAGPAAQAMGAPAIAALITAQNVLTGIASSIVGLLGYSFSTLALKKAFTPDPACGALVDPNRAEKEAIEAEANARRSWFQRHVTRPLGLQ